MKKTIYNIISICMVSVSFCSPPIINAQSQGVKQINSKQLIQKSVLTAGTTIFKPTDDTYLYKGETGTGNEIRCMETTFLTYHSSGAIYCREAFIKFDFSTIANPVDSAILKVYGGDAFDHTMEVYSLSGTSWAEDGLTYNNQSLMIGTQTLIATTNTLGKGVKYYEWDLSKAVASLKASEKTVLAIRFVDKIAVYNSAAKAQIVSWQSKETTTGFPPLLVIKEKLIDNLLLSEIKVDNQIISDFNATKFSYNYSLPYNAVSIPQVTAVAPNSSTSIRIENCKSLDGNVADRTTKIIVKQNNDSLIYKVIFLKQPQPNNTKLNAIIVDGDSIENFVQSKNSFKINLPYTAISSPSIIPITAANLATYVIEPATNILGSTNERTAKIIVTSEDKTATESYTLVFNILPKLDLFLLIGQSNMCGRGTMTPEYMDTISNTFLLTPRAEMEPAVNPINKYSTVRKDLIYEQVGPGYGFSKSLVNLTGSNIGLVSNARGATAISSWTKGSVDRLYEEAVLRMKVALKWGKLKAILWHQGEADSKNPDSYKTKLYNMVQNLRTDLESPNVFFVAGELAYWRDGGTGSTAFNAMIRTISTFIPNTSWVSAEGLTPLIDVTDPHFDAKSQVIFGGRYADEVIKYCYNSTKLVQPQNTNNSITFTTDKNTVYIKNTTNEIVNCSIYLTNGMLVNKAKSSSDFDLKISKSGIYIVNISSDKFNMVYKIVI